MSQEYANQQPAGYVNYLRNIAIVGVSGQMGKWITEAVLRNGKHTLTAITRADSTSPVPEGVQVKKVDYNDHASLVAAMQGQDALIITMATTAPRDTSAKLVKAAADAKVPWVLPNEWGIDLDNESLAHETLLGDRNLAIRKLIKEIGGSSYIAFVNGFWYDYSLAFGPATYGFDIPNRTVTFFDDGKTKINTSSFPQCGNGAAALLAFKILPDNENDKSPTLSQFRDKSVYVSSFALSQEDMLDSVLRVTGDKREDWTIKHQDVKERWQQAMDEFDGGKGPHVAYARVLYSRVFYPDGSGNYGEHKGLHNDILGLQEEDVDKWTKAAVEKAMAEAKA